MARTRSTLHSRSTWSARATRSAWRGISPGFSVAAGPRAAPAPARRVRPGRRRARRRRALRSRLLVLRLESHQPVLEAHGISRMRRASAGVASARPDAGTMRTAAATSSGALASTPLSGRGCPPAPPARGRRAAAPARPWAARARPTPATAPVDRLGQPLHQEAQVPLVAGHAARHAQHELHVVGRREVALARGASAACRACRRRRPRTPGTSPRSRSRAAIRTMSGRAFTNTSSPKFMVPRLSVPISAPSTSDPSRSSTRHAHRARRSSTARPRRCPPARMRSTISRKWAASCEGRPSGQRAWRCTTAAPARQAATDGGGDLGRRVRDRRALRAGHLGAHHRRGDDDLSPWLALRR